MGSREAGNLLKNSKNKILIFSRLVVVAYVPCFFQLMKKSVITSDFEKRSTLPQMHRSKYAEKKQRKVSTFLLVYKRRTIAKRHYSLDT